MKKFLFVFGLLFSFYSSVMGQPGGGPIDIDEVKPERFKRDFTMDMNCITISFNLGPRLIVLGCEGKYQYEGEEKNIVVKRTCFSELGDFACNIKVELFLNDVQVGKEQIFSGLESTVFEIDYKNLANILGEDYLLREAYLDIKVSKLCPGAHGMWESVIGTESVTIQVRGPGEKYVEDEFKGTDQDILCDELYNSKFEKLKAYSCCVTSVSLDAIVKKLSGSKLEISGSITAADGPFSVSMTESRYEVSESINTFSISKNYDIPSNNCIYPAIKLLLEKHRIVVKRVDCDFPDGEVNEIRKYLKIFDVEPWWCEASHPCDHQDPDPDFLEEDGGFLRDIANACSSSIYVDLKNPVAGMHYEYEWIAQDGTTYNTKDITNVPYGKYELTIYDECCNEYKYTYNLCDETTYGDWYYNEKQYCREVTCNCIPTFRSPNDNTYIMCVTPQRYDSDWSFDDSRKKCTKHAYWTDQNGVEIDLTDAVNEDDIDAEDENVVKEPIIDDHYDNTTKQCVRDYYCETDETSYNHIVQPPTNYGAFWNFESFDNTCHREVYCFDNFEPVEEEQIIDAEINWTFNLVTGMCDATVYCDGFQQYGAYVPPHFPYDQTEWMLYTPDDTHCQKTVTCEYGEEETVEVGMTIDVNVDGTCPTDQPNHIIWYCNNEFVADDCLGPEATEELINNSNFSETSIDKIAGLMTIYPNPYQDNVKITIVSDNKTNLKIDLLSITGKKIVSKTQKITKGENSFLLNDVKDIKKGMYFLHLYDNQNISYTYKLIKE